MRLSPSRIRRAHREIILLCGLVPSASACSRENREPEPTASAQKENATPQMGRIRSDAPLPIAELIGAPPAQVESHLGDPTGKGRTREMCVRFVPKRTWFRCKYAWQQYESKQAPPAAVGVVYEDGMAASLQWVGLQGTGAVRPEEALRQVGLELPGQPEVLHPQENVTVWYYPNSQARLLIDNRQYFVRVSTVEDDWKRAKVELELNDPLDESERQRVIEPSD